MADAKKKPDSGGKQAGKPKKLLANGLDPSVGKANQFKPGQSGNPAGKPPGTKSLSAHIQALLNDEEFDAWVVHPIKGFEHFEGAPMKAILKALAIKAINGDAKAFDLLAKYGYGTKVELTGLDGGPIEINPFSQLTAADLRKLARGK